MHTTMTLRAMYFGTPVVLISTINTDGSANLAPMSSAWWVGDSCMLGLDETSQTTINLRRTGECVLNLPSADMVSHVDRLAMLTGAEQIPPHKQRLAYRFEPSKFEVAGLSPQPSDIVAAPRAEECPVQLESVLRAEHEFGGDDSGVVAFEVHVVMAHVEESLRVNDSDRYIDPDRWDPLIMKFCEFYGYSQNVHTSALAHGWGMPARNPPA